MSSEDIWGVFGTRLVLAFAQLQANNKPANSTKDINSQADFSADLH